MMTKKIFFLADPLPTMRKNILLTNSNKPFIGYDNVVYEESILIPDSYDWIYFIPQEGIHYSNIPEGKFNYISTPFTPYELYNPVSDGWTTSPFETSTYPYGNSWGRYWGLIPAHMNWQQTANLGFKTIAEYNALLSQMDNTTKRNLTGTRIYQ